MSFSIHRILLLILVLSFPAKYILSQDSLAIKNKIDKYNEWNFRLSPYAWFINIKGEVVTPYVPPVSPEPPPPSQHPEEEPKYSIDLSFKDLRSSIKFASMLSGKYRNKHILIQLNFSSVIMEGSGITPFDLLIQNTEMKLWYYSGDLGIGYRFIQNPKFELDGIIGSKFLYSKVRLTTEILGKKVFEGERDKFWYNPFVGISVFYYPIKRLELGLYADIGSRFKAGDITSQFWCAVSGMITKWFYLSLDYRYYFVDVPKEEAVLTGNVRGVVFKIGFQF